MRNNLVDILKIIPDVQLDIRYAQKNNFIGFPVYTLPKCFLHSDAAEALKKVYLDLKNQGLGMKLFDGYRPIPVQQIMWDLVQDENYVANPAKGNGRHTRGTAIDLTLVDRQGVELPMPSDFDEFTARAHYNYRDGPLEALHNRDLLKSVMEKHGFLHFAFEWWHFDLKGWENIEKYPALAATFEELLEK